MATFTAAFGYGNEPPSITITDLGTGPALVISEDHCPCIVKLTDTVKDQLRRVVEAFDRAEEFAGEPPVTWDQPLVH